MKTDPTPTRLAKVRALAASGDARAIRIAARLSLQDVATGCGVDQSSIHNWETARRSPRGEAALRYLAILEALIKAAA